MKNYSISSWAGAFRALAFCLLVFATNAPAAVTNVAWYRLGEKDAGAVSGNVVKTATVDFVGGRDLRRVGSPFYTNAVTTSAARGVGSTLGVRFNGGNQFLSNAVLSTARNNFGIEAWVDAQSGPPVNPGNYFVAYNGNPNGNGWGIGLFVDEFSGPSFFGLFGGVTGVGARRASRAAHLALVRDNGVTTFYVNGVAAGTSATAPVAPAGAFSIGTGFPGVIDEVRVFTFAPGEFSTDDLLVKQQRAVTVEPSDIAPDHGTLNGTASSYGLPTAAWFEWGTTESLGEVTPVQTLNSRIATASYSQVLTGLSSGATYYFRAVASNALGLATGAVLELSAQPTVATLAATDIGPAAAVLHGIANSKGVPASIWFEWGATTNYGNTTPPQTLAGGGGPTNFSATLANLFPGGTFHYRAVLSDGVRTLTGGNQSFGTPVDASADRVIPGGVGVTVQPPEAAADGARWSLDNGPEMFSGFTQALVPPGRHTVRFRDLPNWREPAPVEVYVVGGKTSEVAVAFSPIPTFAVGTVPEQHARAGETVEFFVNGVAPGGQLQVTGNPPPGPGSFNFDSASGRVTYTPAAERLPFTLTYLLNGAPVATSTITPLQSLSPEEVVINYDRPLPDDESRDYITITENLSPTTELFNSVSNQLLTVDISGKTLVFDEAHHAHLLPSYNHHENIKEFHLYAERVIIRSPLFLPQTHVTIHARELRFEGTGVIDTTPLARWTKPREVRWTDDNVIGFPGSPGHNGGDVDVFVERFHADPAPAVRFVLHGGDGGPSGEGRNGVPDYGDVENPDGSTNRIFFFTGDPNWLRLMSRAGNSTECGIANNALVLYREIENNGVPDPMSICGSQTAVARGEPAVPSGIPGAGGRGGTLRATLDLAPFVAQSGGAPGASGATNYNGGTLLYQYNYHFTNFRHVKQQTFIDTWTVNAPKVAGANAAPPTGTPGALGSVVRVSDPSSWLHSFSLRALVHFAKDAYLNGHDAEARALMDEYRDVLRVLQPVVGSVTNLSDAEFAETTSLDQLALEMGSIVDRVDMNLDFFGNPAGWVPMLSFEANLTAFQNEINQSIPILYLSYWLNYSATNLQNSAAASAVALDKMREEFTRMVNAYNEAQTSIPRLKGQADRIRNEIAGLHFTLLQLEQQLAARAQANVEERHKVPFWKKALGVLSVAADLVPIGQPTVGKIGAGLSLLTKIDPDHPVESALAITNAFDAFKNKDISICYGSSTTNGTNSSNSTTNSAAKKAKLKLNSECGKFLQAELKELVGVFKEVQVDSKELQAEIEKLKASDPVFLETAAQLLELNKEKESFAQELTAAVQALATLTSEMTENTLATGELENRVAQQLTALDHNALVHIKEMERRAKDRLLKFQYFTAKAFQYRLLRPFNGNLQLNMLFDRFQAIVAGPNAHVLTQQEFDNLKNLFIEDLANTTDLAMTTLNANAPQHAQPRTFDLTPDELQILNSTNGEVTIDLRKHALFPSFHEDIRIVNLRVTSVATHPVGGLIGQDAVLFLDLNHRGESRLDRGGQNFLFRHYQTETVSPIAWNAVLDVVHHTTNNSVLSASADSLLHVLLRQPTDANMLLFSRPAADAEILIRREALTDNGIDLALDHLTIEVEYEFSQQSLSQRTLEVKVSDDLQPIIVVSQPDVAGRQDGQGDFRRIFSVNTALTIQAPAFYGGRPFDRWVINNQSRPAGSNLVSVSMTVGITAEARYSELPSSSGAAPTIQPPASATVMLGNTATFTVTASGTGPLAFRWQKNGTPMTDGGRITGAATPTLAVANVGLTDAAAYSIVVSNAFGARTSQAAQLTVVGSSLAPVPAGPGDAGFQFDTAGGRRYIIEHKFTLSDPAWTPVQTNIGTGGRMTFTRPTSAVPSSFFRLRAE